MKKTVGLDEAQAQLATLVDEAAAGEEIVIAKQGRPVARLVALFDGAPCREPGQLKGEIWVADDFDELPPELLAAFYDEPIEPPEDQIAEEGAPEDRAES